MTPTLKVSRLQKRGQVTIPIGIRRKLGLEEGDLVAFVETEEGVLISSQAAVVAGRLSKHLEEPGAGLKELFSFFDRIASGTAEREPATTKPRRSVAQQTAGIFRRPERPEPLDFRQLRQRFIEGTFEG